MAQIGTFESQIILAKIASKAWLDRNFKKRLLRNPEKVLTEEGITLTPGIRVKIKTGLDSSRLEVPLHSNIVLVEPTESPRRISQKTFAVSNQFKIKKKKIKKPRYVLSLPRKPIELREEQLRALSRTSSTTESIVHLMAGQSQFFSMNSGNHLPFLFNPDNQEQELLLIINQIILIHEGL